MSEKLDKLGRRIPQFDRSAAGKKAMATLKEKNGEDYPSRIGAHGGHKRTRGHFGKLKDEGHEEKLKSISKEASDARWEDKTDQERADNDNRPGGSGDEPTVSQRGQ